MNDARKKTDKRLLLVISLLASLVLWFVVNVFVNPDGDRVISGIPISLGSGTRTLELLGLDIVDESVGTVTAEVSGSRIAISSLTADSFTVTPRFSPVTAAGTYTLELSVTLDDKASDVQIVSFSPRTIELTLARTETAVFPVTCAVKSDIPDGYYLASLVPAEETVTVTGPDEAVKRIASASVNVRPTASGTLSDQPIVLYDADGKEIAADNLKLSVAKTDVTVSLLKAKELTLSPTLAGYPANMAEGLVTLEVPAESRVVTVAGPDEAIDALETEYPLSVDISTVAGDETRVLPLTLPAGVVSIDGVQEIPLHIRVSSDIFFQDVAVNKFELSPALQNSGADVTVTTKSLKVRIAGSEDVIAAVTEKNLVATVLYDSDQPLQKGQYSLKTLVRFRAANPEDPSYDGQFWVIYGNDVIVKVN